MTGCVTGVRYTSNAYFMSQAASTPVPLSKRELAAFWSARLGVTRLLELLPPRAALLVLNYHRIGDPNKTPYDPGTFSATTSQFDQQVGWLKKRFPIITLEEALATAEATRTVRRTEVLITFDDGYLDNYQEAFQVLRSHGVPATFFLPTCFVGARRVPWWDEIAYVIKHSPRRKIQLTYPEPAAFDIDEIGLNLAIMRILMLAVKPENRDREVFLTRLEESCGSFRPQGEAAERCFLTWEEAREMLRRGMEIGSHTHSHEILSTLSASEQREELARSQAILRAELGKEIDTIAYPVGLRHTFTTETIDVARSMGYRGGFSFYGGLNHPGRINTFDIRRYPVMLSPALHRMRLQTAWVSALGEGWL